MNTNLILLEAYAEIVKDEDQKNKFFAIRERVLNKLQRTKEGVSSLLKNPKFYKTIVTIVLVAISAIFVKNYAGPKLQEIKNKEIERLSSAIYTKADLNNIPGYRNREPFSNINPEDIVDAVFTEVSVAVKKDKQLAIIR